MRDKVIRTIVQYGMLQKGDAVLVGLSGGADSTVLLHILCSMREDWGLTVCAAHLNHCLRGTEADRDEAFCRSLCRQLNVPFAAEKADAAGEAKRSGESVEQCGRRLRYAMFEREAGKQGAKIATAHTLSDHVETVLLNLTRGTGLRGLVGIPAVRENIIRPLIECSRAEIERYAAGQGLAFVEDSSNQSRDYARNRVRLDVIPVLESINPGLALAVGRLSGQAREDERFLSGMAEKLLQKTQHPDGYCAKTLLQAPLPVLSRAVIRAAQDAGSGMMEQAHVESMLHVLQKNGKVCLPGGVEAAVQGGMLRFERNMESRKPPEGWHVPFKTGKIVREDGAFITVSLVEETELEKIKNFHKKLLKYYADCDTINFNAEFRTRRPGDRFRPIGRGCSKTLKKLFSESKIPQPQRENTVVLAGDDGPIWVEGFGFDEAVRVTGKTKHALMIEVQRSGVK